MTRREPWELTAAQRLPQPPPQRGDRVLYEGRLWLVIGVFHPLGEEEGMGLRIRRPVWAPRWWPWRESRIVNAQRVEVSQK